MIHLYFKSLPYFFRHIVVNLTYVWFPIYEIFYTSFPYMPFEVFEWLQMRHKTSNDPQVMIIWNKKKQVQEICIYHCLISILWTNFDFDRIFKKGNIGVFIRKALHMHLISVWHLMSYRYTKGLKDHIWTYTVVLCEETGKKWLRHQRNVIWSNKHIQYIMTLERFSLQGFFIINFFVNLTSFLQYKMCRKLT